MNPKKSIVDYGFMVDYLVLTAAYRPPFSTPVAGEHPRRPLHPVNTPGLGRVTIHRGRPPPSRGAGVLTSQLLLYHARARRRRADTMPLRAG